MYIFRYQYLLLKVGTVVLRKVFDHIVGDDFMRYLNAHKPQYDQLQYLMNRDIISDTQKQFLPPLDTKPSSSNFDISLLALLLRNVCGLRYQQDSVWLNPAAGDTTIEADITRLRICRNNLQHRREMCISESEFAAKWTELCQILHRLNKVAGLPQLQSDIDDAEQMPLDETLEEQLNQKLKELEDSDRLTELRFEEVESDVTTVKHKLAGITKKVDALTEKDAKSYDKLSDLRQTLLDTYRRDFCNLPLSVLCTEEEEEFFQVYKSPTMQHVDYHRAEVPQVNNNISSFRDIFIKDKQCFHNIYVTGDAGVGKTSLCKCLCLLWCKSQTESSVDDHKTQGDVNFLARFKFVFCISLKDTECRDTVSMVAEQFFDSDSKALRKSIEQILRHHECLVIFDALDEWNPNLRGTRACRIPERALRDKCVYLTTCRPYIIENVRLTRREIDQQVRLSGIHGKSTEGFIGEVVKHMNKENGAGKSANDFMKDVINSGLDDQLCMPMIASHLVVVWFAAHTLTDMSKALLCGKILELLFTRAKQRNVKSPDTPASDVQLPRILSKLRYVKEHVPLLQKLCFLSFRLLFKQDEHAVSLVFTRDQLRCKPYLIGDEEMDFLCKIGILSKNKVIGFHESYQLSLSFLHKSYMEFFAALFVSSFDTDNALDKVSKEWTNINDVVQYQNFFLFLAGFSYQRVKRLFYNIYVTISDDLASCRRNAIFHYYPYSYVEQIKLLQTILTSCWKEGGRYNNPNNDLQLQDFIYDDSSNVEALDQLASGTSPVTSLYSVKGRYLDQFDQFTNLQFLRVGKIVHGEYSHFNECMLRNQATLHTVCFEGDFDTKPLIPALPLNIHQPDLACVPPTVKSPMSPVQQSGYLKHLTSLSLTDVKMQHQSLHNLVLYLSNNVLIENIFLRSVYCGEHKEGDGGCSSTLALDNHNKLTTLCLWNVNIVCRDVDISGLKCIALRPFSEGIVSCYTDVFHCIKNWKLECLRVNGHYKLDCNTMNTLVSTVKTLLCVKFLSLRHLALPEDVSLQLHPQVEQVEIRLTNVTMSQNYFHSCIVAVVSNHSVKEAELNGCIITSNDRDMTAKESFDYMSKYLTPKSNVHITYKDKYRDQYLDGYVLWLKQHDDVSESVV